ncbi:Stromal interaction molecule 1 [Halotydeus destructor]|nr:Stromal interaction molecule 1 [Halotydeus destructor]
MLASHLVTGSSDDRHVNIDRQQESVNTISQASDLVSPSGSSSPVASKNSNKILEPNKLTLDVNPVVHIKENSNAISSPTSSEPCDTQFEWCQDKQGFEAIRWLHRQLDDDANGNVDLSESDEFLRDELQYEHVTDRHKAFHGNDKQVSVDELWLSWSRSEVHNWTVDETSEWLSSNVELPQYVEHFARHSVNGTKLPRLAASTTYMVKLGISDPIHRQKISLKAMDIVLFGPSKRHNYHKDVILAMAIVMATGGLWFAYAQHKSSQAHVKKMLRDMESLQAAEEKLCHLQSELHKARHDQELVMSEKETLAKRLEEEMANSLDHNSRLDDENNHNELSSLTDNEQISQLEKELTDTREQLQMAERQLEEANNSWTPPRSLQKWLMITHEHELKNYGSKRQQAEMQLGLAKDSCEKLRKKRATFMGSFRVAHGSSIDDVDNRILQARQALSEVTKDLEERLHRWRQIEMICGFSIVTGTQSPTGMTHSVSETSLVSTATTIVGR